MRVPGRILLLGHGGLGAGGRLYQSPPSRPRARLRKSEGSVRGGGAGKAPPPPPPHDGFPRMLPHPSPRLPPSPAPRTAVTPGAQRGHPWRQFTRSSRAARRSARPLSSAGPDRSRPRGAFGAHPARRLEAAAAAGAAGRSEAGRGGSLERRGSMRLRVRFVPHLPSPLHPSRLQGPEKFRPPSRPSPAGARRRVLAAAGGAGAESGRALDTPRDRGGRFAGQGARGVRHGTALSGWRVT